MDLIETYTTVCFAKIYTYRYENFKRTESIKCLKWRLHVVGLLYFDMWLSAL